MAATANHTKFEFKKVKIFADGADRNSILALAKNPLVKGFTTNPSLMRKAGIKDYGGFCREICAEIPDRPFSFEVFADDFSEMKRQALEIASWGGNIYVKIPVTNSEGLTTAKLVRELSASGVKLNVTALLTLDQVTEVCTALHGGAPSIVSVFAGRIADAGVDPVPLMRAAAAICRSYGSQIELLWASTREPLNLIQADEVGCDIITVTPDVLGKIGTFGKDLRTFSLETVRMFKADAEAVGFTL
jgi:transaldolase